MSDLISRSAFADVMCSACNEYFPDEPCEPSECDLCIALANAPAVDAVPVVRCRDCKHFWDADADFTLSKPLEPVCRKNKGLVAVTEESFCSYGERKDR